MVAKVPISRIKPNPNQPRQYFDDERLEELAASIRIHGILQPLLLKRVNGDYQIIAGERRWRAAQLAGLEAAPALIEDLTELQQMEIALIENIQREDLNAIEEAKAFSELITRHKISQEELAKQVGKGRTTIANSLRLLRLPVPIQQDIEAGRLTAGHARAILSLESTEKQRRLHTAILAEDLSVRAAEQLAKRLNEPKQPVSRREPEGDPQVRALEEKLLEVLGSLARIKMTSPTQGRIEIAYTSLDDLDRILSIMGVESETL